MIGGHLTCGNEGCENYGLIAFSQETMDREKKYWQKEENETNN